ncbi:NUDIX hydrolase [Sphingomonas silueang]|uniref:NUDIX hydrolase n=1 Tax=Sphingomonas silueang TaxID=3156617 RepID=UPI0032B4C239
MDDADFLATYDPARYDRPSVAVDIVVLGIVQGRPAALLSRRDRPPFAGHWALPGGFVGIAESLDDAARRILAARTGIAAAVEQLHCFGAVDRDPRMRIVSVAYRALLSPAMLAAVPTDADRAFVALDGAGGDGLPPLAFDHAAILGTALRRLRRDIDAEAFGLLGDDFTLRELQAVHEAVLGRALNKPAFRRRMLDSGRIAPTGTHESGTAFRPAARYRATTKE